MTDRENLLRTYRFQGPERVPVHVGIGPAMWRLYGKPLEDVVARHPVLFPHFARGSIEYGSLPVDPRNKASTTYTDAWGCVYRPTEDDVPCYVCEKPLETWDNFGGFSPPNPEETNGRGPLDWQQIEANVRQREEAGQLNTGSLVHGHLFLRLEDLRGYQNLILDMIDEEPRLLKLIAMVERFSMHIVQRFAALGVDIMHYPEDLGAQDRPMISPELFRRYMKPTYARLMAPARQVGILVHMHSDGYLWDLMDDILEAGVDIINLQDLVNGIDDIAKNLKGRVAIDLDVDRQRITRFGSPRDIDDLVREEVMKLGSPQGGLSLRHGVYSGAPLENVDALLSALEKYSLYYS